MKYIQTFFFITTLVFSAKSQNVNDKILELFLKDANFSKFVIPAFNKYKNCDTLYIVDTTKSFSDTVKINFPKSIIVLRDYKKTPPFRRWYCYNLILSVKKSNKQHYVIEYFHEPSNSVGFIQYKLIKGQFKKIKERYGQY